VFGHENVNDQQQQHQDAYQMIVQQSDHHSSGVAPAQRDYLIREIFETEKRYTAGLQTLVDDFLIPLSKVLNDKSVRKMICINLESLVQLHSSLLNELKVAIKGAHGRTIRICNVFDSYKLALMKEYVEYFSNIDQAIAKCDSLSNGKQQNNDFKRKLEECRAKSEQRNFKLTDLLRLPSQRILKYHLLFTNLLKNTNEEHSAKETIKKTRDAMLEVGSYLNECQRDNENLIKIQKVFSHLTGDFKMSLLSTSKDYGRYIMDDNIRIKLLDEKIPRSRTLILFENALFICKSKGNSYNYKETLLNKDYSIEDATSQGSNSQTNSNNNSNSNTLNSNGTSGTSNVQLENQSMSSLSQTLQATSLALMNNSAHHSLIYRNSNRNYRDFIFYFKNQEQKRIWRQNLLMAKDKIQPEGQRNNNHMFILHNFDHELVNCSICKKYLHGIFYQGYKCEFCSIIAHKSCLTVKSMPACKMQSLRSNNQVPLLTQQLSQQRLSLPTPTTVSNQRQPTFAKVLYKYDGRPQCPDTSSPILLLNVGDIIHVTDDDDDVWWRGYPAPVYSSSTTATQLKQQQKDDFKIGVFPRRNVKLITSDLDLDEYPWFSPVDRNTADLILNRIHHLSTIFMVRFRQDGGYAISIKYNGTVDHIKINATDNIPINLTNTTVSTDDNGPATSTTINIDSQLFSIDQRNFSSIQGLVNFYKQNLLQENFPQLETTLGTAYREALPKPIGQAIAIHGNY
jgi:guanine nucleotide exchange factor VAV